MKRHIIIGIIVVALAGSCVSDSQSGTVDIPLEVLQEGDLALRRGSSMASNIVIMMDSAATYSHIGLVTRCGDEWMVVHAVPDERDDGGVDTIKADPIATFFLPSRAKRGAIVRLDVDSVLRHRAAREAIALVERHVKFDHDYSWTDTTRLYCTQLVQQCYLKAGVDVAQGRKQRIDAPGYHGDYVFPSDLLAHPRTRVIFKY
ncbi:MAG: hypothetical protein J5565_06035 [Muribaculaceae bacterium]|nr:hypothetical protein [Muribaculaceae bacterium]